MDFNQYQKDAKKTAIYHESIERLIEPLVKAVEALVEGSVARRQAVEALAQIRHTLAISYSVLGLVGEAGEIANKAKKVIRDDKDPSELAPEIGDVLWYSADLSTNLGVELGFIAEHNHAKLLDRMEQGKLKGDGDKR